MLQLHCATWSMSPPVLSVADDCCGTHMFILLLEQEATLAGLEPAISGNLAVQPPSRRGLRQQ